jgi:hypothetical protein
MTRSTISRPYQREQQVLHENARYGRASIAFAPLVRALAKAGRCASISDYGAGKCRLSAALGDHLAGIDYRPYDPAFPEYGPARPADLVACIDVLEHVEPSLLESCLDDLGRVTEKLILLSVHTGPARKFLSDGRNAHLIQQPADWWVPQFERRIDVLHVRHVRKGFLAIGCAKGSSPGLTSKELSRLSARWKPRAFTTRLKFRLVTVLRKLELTLARAPERRPAGADRRTGAAA